MRVMDETSVLNDHDAQVWKMGQKWARHKSKFEANKFFSLWRTTYYPSKSSACHHARHAASIGEYCNVHLILSTKKLGHRHGRFLFLLPPKHLLHFISECVNFLDAVSVYAFLTLLDNRRVSTSGSP